MKPGNTGSTSHRGHLAITKNYLRAALAVAALAIAGTAPAFATTHRPSTDQSSAARDEALRQCTAAAAQYSDASWESQKSATFANCMNEHGQQP